MKKRFTKKQHHNENARTNKKVVGICTMFTDARYIYDLRY